MRPLIYAAAIFLASCTTLAPGPSVDMTSPPDDIQGEVDISTAPDRPDLGTVPDMTGMCATHLMRCRDTPDCCAGLTCVGGLCAKL